MHVVRSLTALCALAAVVLVATAASAIETYTFTGKLNSNRGLFINIPVVGNTPCATAPYTRPLTGGGMYQFTPMGSQPVFGTMAVPGALGHVLRSGPGITMTPPVPAPNTPASRTMSNWGNMGGMNPPNTAPGQTTPNNPPGTGSCVKVGPGQITTSGAGIGGSFDFPPLQFSDPLPGKTVAVSVMIVPQVIQLATSFGISGPQATRTTPNNGTMNTGANTAPFRHFQKSAFTNQTGRLADKFTWCWGSAACSKITQGGYPLIVKYAGGGNAFGGTMAYVINAGVGVTSSLAIAAGGGMVGFAILAGMGSQPTGGGYAHLLSDYLMTGPLWNMYMLNTVTTSLVGMQVLITKLTSPLGMLFPKATNLNYGFPLTTMTVLARNTGVALGNPVVTTITAMGRDTTTPMGNRNISLVAGSVAHVTPLNTNTPNIVQLTLPEPGATAQLLAGVLGLLGVGVWRARKSR